MSDMRYMGIDYGTRRIGMAQSDEEGRVAFPERIIPAREDAIVRIQKIATASRAGAIVVGLPVNMDGTEGETAAAARAFGAALGAATRLPVWFENEMFTTRMAAASGSGAEHRDASSAAIILQSYLDRMNKKI